MVGAYLTLPVDVEPYGPGDSEYAAAQRLLRRVIRHWGPRFADYVVGDGEYATAPFLHTTAQVGLPVVARLKENLPLPRPCDRALTASPPGHLPARGRPRRELPPQPGPGLSSLGISDIIPLVDIRLSREREWHAT